MKHYSVNYIMATEDNRPVWLKKERYTYHDTYIFHYNMPKRASLWSTVVEFFS